jgi:hypothetical protein
MPANPTVHPEHKVVWIGPDGSGGWFIRTTTPDGQHGVFPLDLERAARLQVLLAQAIRELAVVALNPPQARPPS